MVDPEAMEEERRLCYVGITRAMDRLYLLHTFRRTIFGENRLSVASRFLADIPSSLAEQQPATPGGRFTRPEQAATRLGAAIGGGSVTRWSSSQSASAPSRLVEPSFKVGDTVVHTVFGEGVVVKIHLTDDDQEVEVAFPGRGIKRLSVNFAPLTRKG